MMGNICPSYPATESCDIKTPEEAIQMGVDYWSLNPTPPSDDLTPPDDSSPIEPEPTPIPEVPEPVPEPEPVDPPGCYEW